MERELKGKEGGEREGTGGGRKRRGGKENLCGERCG